jgi:hypothetical protein
MKKIVLLLFLLIILFGCTEADIASSNVSKAADQFEIYRRVVFYNGITDNYILVIEGYCSVQRDTDGDINVIAKTAPGTFIKHMLGLSDNVTWFAEQIEPSKVPTDQYRVIFKPSAIIPNIDIK